jgi:hypothetical protein
MHAQRLPLIFITALTALLMAGWTVRAAETERDIGKAESQIWSDEAFDRAVQIHKAEAKEQQEFVGLYDKEIKGLPLNRAQKIRLLELHIARTESFRPYSEKYDKDWHRVLELRFLETLDDHDALTPEYQRQLDDLLLWQVGYDRDKDMNQQAEIFVRDGHLYPSLDRQPLYSEFERLKRLSKHGRIDAAGQARLNALQVHYKEEDQRSGFDRNPQPGFHALYAKSEVERRNLFALENAEKNGPLDERDALELKTLRAERDRREAAEHNRVRCCARMPPVTDPVQIKFNKLSFEARFLEGELASKWPYELVEEDDDLEVLAKQGKLDREARARYARLGELKTLIPNGDTLKDEMTMASLERLNKEIVALGGSPTIPRAFLEHRDRELRQAQEAKKRADEDREIEDWKVELAKLRAESH